MVFGCIIIQMAPLTEESNTAKDNASGPTFTAMRKSQLPLTEMERFGKNASVIVINGRPADRLTG